VEGKKRVKKIVGETKIDGDITIVSHQTYLSQFTATKWNEKSEPLDGKVFKNCEIMQVGLEILD